MFRVQIRTFDDGIKLNVFLTTLSPHQVVDIKFISDENSHYYLLIYKVWKNEMQKEESS
jgi:hypothetical protein